MSSAAVTRSESPRATPPRSGGRPTAEAAALLERCILDHATIGFLRDGYAATSIEAIARDARVAKRTIYARWNGKPALFLAVARRLMTTWLSVADGWRETDDLEASLHAAAGSILDVGLTAEAVALNRMMIAEGARFPELQEIMDQAGAQEGVRRIARILARGVAAGQLRPLDIPFAAEAFLHLVLAGPQRRALGLRRPLDRKEREMWQQAAVQLFLSGCLAVDAGATTERPMSHST